MSDMQLSSVLAYSIPSFLYCSARNVQQTAGTDEGQKVRFLYDRSLMPYLLFKQNIDIHNDYINNNSTMHN